MPKPDTSDAFHLREYSNHHVSYMYLVNKIKAINKVFDELELHISNFKEEACISCKSNCGICCQKTDIEATVLEFLPAAMNLYRSGEHEHMINQSGNNPYGLCVFYNPFERKGFCSRYQDRGLVCRLFGFAVSRDKYDNPVLVTCKTIKQSLDQEKLKKTIDKAPEMAYYYLKLFGIDSSLSVQYFPINISIRKAFEIVLLYFENKKRSA